MGVVLNRVTPQGLPEVEQIVVPTCLQGIEVLGVIRWIAAGFHHRPAAGEILQGKVVCGEAAWMSSWSGSASAPWIPARRWVLPASSEQGGHHGRNRPISSSPRWRPRLAAWCSRATRCEPDHHRAGARGRRPHRRGLPRHAAPWKSWSRCWPHPHPGSPKVRRAQEVLRERLNHAASSRSWTSGRPDRRTIPRRDDNGQPAMEVGRLSVVSGR